MNGDDDEEKLVIYLLNEFQRFYILKHRNYFIRDYIKAEKY